ncbi:hypothetical protein LTR85_007339 [Meristemomyces frigidus]|nr:hypothetical protein LTR85_007339 [Meristemomyces frigidus]
MQLSLDRDLSPGEQTLPLLPGSSAAVDSDANLDALQLFEVLWRTAHFQCQDPRDKWYASLFLLPSPIPAPVRPDYNRSLADVYSHLAWYLIANNISGALQLAQGMNADSTMPSWVVDWRSLPRDVQLAKRSEQVKWFAGFPDGHRRVYARRSEKLLVLRGLLVDTVKCCWGSRNTGMRFVTQQGLHGQAIGGVDAGDLVCIFLGSRAPFLMKPQRENRSQLMGECVVDGVMHGEAVTDLDWASVEEEKPVSPLQDFSIV